MSKDWIQEDQYVGVDIDGYILEEEIGRGEISVVYKAYNKEINNFAICKIIKKEYLIDNWEFKFKIIIDKLHGVRQVLPYLGYFIKNINEIPFLFILSQYMEGKNLNDYLRDNPMGVTPSFVKLFCEEILTLFHAMQIAGISAHNNIHTRNILLVHDPRSLCPEVPIIKVTDFGFGESYINFEKKDARLAMLYSAVLPGAGQFYANPSAVITYIFPILEVAMIGGMIYYDKQRDEKTKDYEKYANVEIFTHTFNYNVGGVDYSYTYTGTR